MAEKKEEKESEEVIKVPEKVVLEMGFPYINMLSARITIKNMTDDMYALKTKCTSNELFGISYTRTIVYPKEKEYVAVCLKPGQPIPPDSLHYFAIYYSKCAPEEYWEKLDVPIPKANPKFWENRKMDGCKRCRVFFEPSVNQKAGGNSEEKQVKNDERKEEKDKKKEEKDEKKEKKVALKKEEVKEVKKKEPKEDSKEKKMEKVEKKK